MAGKWHRCFTRASCPFLPSSHPLLPRSLGPIPPFPFQVSDLAQYGSVEDVAKLLLPRGSTLLGSVSIVEPRASKETPFGTVDIPPRTYYL